jgi:protease-4
MKEFLKYTLATIVGLILTFLLIFFILAGVISSLIPHEEAVILKPNSVLLISLDQEITDRSSNNPFENLSFMNIRAGKLGLNDILRDIEKAKGDVNIKGIYLDLSDINTGIATVEEIRNALLSFKESKKFIISYADVYSQTAYYLASVADRLYLNPQGIVEYKGLHAQVVFLKGTLEKLGIEPEVIKHGKFKSAVESFTLDKMSPENREQTDLFIKSIWNNMLEGISKERKISIEQLNILADSMKIRNALAAVDNNLIDGLKYKDQVIDEIKDTLKIKKEKEIKFVTLTKYNKVPKKTKDKGFAKDKVAVIYATGDIIKGRSRTNIINSDRLAKTISEARTDNSVKAIVLRVNSPGGSALASEVIWREVSLARQVKPFIVSMGDVAASGGYYISCAADTIVASPNTITGSIGVFGLLFNTQKFLKDKLGVTVDGVGTNRYSDFPSITRPLLPAEKEVIQQEIENVYTVFLTHVSEGRRLSIEKVDEIGQGRVWSGVNAREIGLIDEFGGLQAAIDIAVKKAKLDKYRVIDLPKQKNPLQEIIDELTGDSESSIISKELGDSYLYYLQLKECLNMKGIQARMPYIIDIY